MSEWKEVSLKEICEFKYGKSLPAAKRLTGDIPVYGSNGIVGYHNEPFTNGTTIVIGRKGSCGEVNLSMTSCCPIDTTYYIDNSATKSDLKWLSYQLSYLELNRLNQAAAVPGLNREDAYRKRILLPPIAQQKRIAAILDQAEALRSARRKAIGLLDELARSVFLEMFGDPVTNPKGWETKGIDDVCELIVDCVNRTAPIEEGITPFKMIRTSNIKGGKVLLKDLRCVTEETFKRWNRRATPKRGDVILTREAPVGEAGIINSDDFVFLGQRLMLYRTDLNQMTSQYLLYSFLGRHLQDQFSREGSGSTVKHLPLPVCRCLEIRVPPLALQQEFTDRIGAIEALKAQHRESLAKLDELFASLQHRAFRGEL
jgi:type I restriction enzyme, S subunit